MTAARHLIFHLGFQKTGTTSIQAMLNANHERLSAIDMRAYGDATKDLRVSGRRYCATPTQQNEDKLRAALKRHVASFVAGTAPYGIVSDENILGRELYCEAGDILTWAKQILPIIEECLGGVPATFVFYTREKDAWFRSIYNQSVKRTGVSAGFEEWRDAAPFELDWDVWQSEIQSVCKTPVRFVAMDEELASGDPLGAALLRLAQVEEPVIGSLTVPPIQNRSLSPRALSFMRFINRLPLKEKHRLKISEAVEKRDHVRGSR